MWAFIQNDIFRLYRVAFGCGWKAEGEREREIAQKTLAKQANLINLNQRLTGISVWIISNFNNHFWLSIFHSFVVRLRAISAASFSLQFHSFSSWQCVVDNGKLLYQKFHSHSYCKLLRTDIRNAGIIGVTLRNKNCRTFLSPEIKLDMISINRIPGRKRAGNWIAWAGGACRRNEFLTNVYHIGVHTFASPTNFIGLQIFEKDIRTSNQIKWIMILIKVIIIIQCVWVCICVHPKNRTFFASHTYTCTYSYNLCRSW